MDDLANAIAPRGLTISILPDKGRCLYSTRDFFPGDVIICQDPFACVPNDLRCEVCFSQNGLKRCSLCQVVCYCGSVCQKVDWKFHRVECSSYSKLSKDRRKSLTPSIRLVVKLCLRRKLQSEKIVPTSATDNYLLVEALVDHMPTLEENKVVLYAQMANLVNIIVQWPEISIKDITRIFSKMACNAHTICNSELQPQGIGLYPVISIINHSCLPNAVLVFEGAVSVIRAVQRIPEGTEVLISYIEMADNTMTRQKALKEQYFFTCTCIRCRDLDHSEYIQERSGLEGYRCSDDNCSGFFLHGDTTCTCQLCGLVKNNQELRKVSCELESLMGKASKALSSKNYLEACSLYRMVEERQLHLHLPRSLSLMRTRECLLRAYMDLENWKEALTYCKLTIPAYQEFYPEYHPLLGLQYYTCGKLEWLLGLTEDAVKSFTKAMDILRVTHGITSPFMKELMMKLDESRAEAAYRRISC